MIAKFCLIFTLCLIGLARADDDVDSLKSQIYTESGISASETYDLLKQLSQKTLDGEQATVLHNYLEANEIKEDKCDVTSFFYLNSNMRDLEEESGNLRRYLQDCINRQFAVCKPIFASKLENAVNQLTDEDRQKAQLMMAKIEEAQSKVETNGAFSYMALAEAQSQFYQGILDFMEYEVAATPGSDLISAENGREKFSEQFNEFVADLCHRVNYALEPGMQIYNLINPFDQMNPESDKSTVEWIQIDTVCEEILEPDTPYTVMDGVFLKLSQRY